MYSRSLSLPRRKHSDTPWCAIADELLLYDVANSLQSMKSVSSVYDDIHDIESEIMKKKIEE